MFTEVAPGIFSVDHRVVEGKNGIVFGTRAALAIDAGIDPEEGRAMADFIRARGSLPARLALTHGHGDQTLGAAAFSEAERFAHVATPEVVRRQLPGWAARTDKSLAQTEAETAWPTVTFSEELTLHLGGKTVRFFLTPGHSEDSVCAYVVEERVLFAGDTVVTGIVPAIGDGDSRRMERSLGRLADLEIEVLVAGHGPVLNEAERIRDWLAWQAGYLAGVRRWVGERLAQGQPVESLAEAAEFERFIGDRLPRDRHGMEKRHRDTVACIAREEQRRREAGKA